VGAWRRSSGEGSSPSSEVTDPFGAKQFMDTWKKHHAEELLEFAVNEEKRRGLIERNGQNVNFWL